MRREEEVVITFRGVPVVRLVPVEPTVPSASILDAWAAMPDVAVARGPMCLPAGKVTLRGPGPLASDMLLEDRR